MFRWIKHVLCVIVVSVMASSVGADTGSAKTILVLDASGSMWGQIDGTPKISIAQDVVGDLLQTIPDDQSLGLSAYGHNRKGDCTDIETLVEPGINNRETIEAAVNAISPKGKTPLSEAVLRAAETLKYEEDKATVILISDGVETCNFDPCAVGAQLEEAGIDFTAHVVGFDVAGPEQDGLRCLAENTGGQFLSAANAEELGTALQTVAAAPPPEPIDVTFVAQVEDTDIALTEGLVWTVTNTDTGDIRLQGEAVERIIQSFAPDASYRIEVLRVTDEEQAVVEMSYAPDLETTVVLELPKIEQRATLLAPETAKVGATITVGWTGPGIEKDYISVTTADADSWNRIHATRVDDTSEVPLLMPAEPGIYELRYVLAQTGGNSDDEVLATQTLTIEDIPTDIEAVTAAEAGSTIEVSWNGPGYETDYISVVRDGEEAWRRVHATRIDGDSNVADLLMPGKTGMYEVRYVMAMTGANSDDRVMATQVIEITEAIATLQAPSTVSVGEMAVIEWTGPANSWDYISVAEVGSDNWKRVHAERVTKGENRLRLLMPGVPGTYELRYVMALTGANGDDEILATQSIEVTETVATLSAPNTARIGEMVVLEWTGPAQAGDYISVAEIGSDTWKRIYAERVSAGESRLRLLMPGDPGTYELRYVMALTGANGDDQVLATQEIILESQSASLDMEQSYMAGDLAIIRWEGPMGAGDYISVAEPNSDNWNRMYHVTLREDGPIRLQMPGKPGDYVVRYVLALSGANGDDEVVTERPVTILAHEIDLTAPETAAVGRVVEIAWTGPSLDADYVSVAEIGSRSFERVNSRRVSEGNPISLQMPDRAGTYEIRYVHGLGNSNGDDVVAHRIDIIVE